MKDVYAEDDAAPATAALHRATFLIEADADPDALSRIAMTLALANRAPRTFRLERPGAGERLVVEAAVDTSSAGQADLVRRKLLQLSCVRTVSDAPSAA